MTAWRAAGAEVVLAFSQRPSWSAQAPSRRWLLEGSPIAPVGPSASATSPTSRSAGWAAAVLRVGAAAGRPLGARQDLAALLASTVAGPRSCTTTPWWRPTRLARSLEAVADQRDAYRGGRATSVSGQLRIDDKTLASATRLERLRCARSVPVGQRPRVQAEDPVESITPAIAAPSCTGCWRFFAKALDRDPGAGWTDADLERLHAIVDHVGEAYRAG